MPGDRQLRAAGLLAGSASARPDEGPVPAAAVRPETAIFFYPWFGTPARDGAYAHWQQGGSVPPGQVASSYYPARGPYSSSDERVLAAQMRELALAGVSTVVVSWWGQGSVEDQRLPRVISAARRAGLGVAAHLEPYAGRTVRATPGTTSRTCACSGCATSTCGRPRSSRPPTGAS